MAIVSDQVGEKPKRPERPFRTAILRGLGVLIPPLLTIVIFVWVASVVHQYVLAPVTAGVRSIMVWQMADIRHDLPHVSVPSDRVAKVGDNGGLFALKSDRYGPMLVPRDVYDRTTYVEDRLFYKADDDTYVPLHVYNTVRKNPREEPLPRTGRGVYARYIEINYLKPRWVIPCFLAVFILVLYLLGKFIAARVGHGVWALFERGVLNVPVIRPVYSSVKQVSDFVFSEREIEFTRVVAVQYPRKGSWTLGFVTGESLLDIRAAANEPVLSVLVPTSPMPVTGFTCTFPKSEVIDLNITIDQAIQFIVSCGVVVPPQQLEKQIAAPLPREVAGSQT